MAARGQYNLAPPTPAEIGRMIRLPAQVAGLVPLGEDADRGSLDQVLLEETAGGPGALPLLEFTLDELFQKAPPRTPA